MLNLMDHAADMTQEAQQPPEWRGLVVWDCRGHEDELQKGAGGGQGDIQKLQRTSRTKPPSPPEAQRQLQLPPTWHRCHSLPPGTRHWTPYLHRSTELPVSQLTSPACSPGHTSGQQVLIDRDMVNQHRPRCRASPAKLVTKANEALTQMTSQLNQSPADPKAVWHKKLLRPVTPRDIAEKPS